MPVVKKYTEQVVIMETPRAAKKLRDLAAAFELPISEVARVALSIGIVKVTGELERRGHEKKEIKRAVRAVKSMPAEKKPLGRPRKKTVPAAQFQAPAV